MTGDHLYYDYRTLFNAMHDVTLKNGALYRCIDEGMILDLPTADVRENVHGEWLDWGGMDIPENHGRHKCSECGEFALLRYEKPLRKEVLSDFCPNCGADMR